MRMSELVYANVQFHHCLFVLNHNVMLSSITNPKPNHTKILNINHIHNHNVMDIFGT